MSGTCGCPGGDDGYGKSCGGATNLGSISSIGGSLPTVTGKLINSGEQNWFLVNFAGDSSNTSYHPKITVTSPDNDVFLIVYSGTCGAVLSCGDGTAQSPTGVAAWEVQYTAGDPTVYPVTGSHFQAIAPVGAVTIEVLRKSGDPATCNSYTLTISE
jgi:hypothetical protein